MNDLLRILRQCDLNPPSSKATIEAVEEEVGIKFPHEYVDFLLHGNGGEGAVGDENYIRLWKVEEIPDLNREYQVDTYAPGFLIIGSDGGGEAIAFDFRCGNVVVCMLPFVGMSPKARAYIGRSFGDFLKKYENDSF
ncbi:MAG: SMI1/KNR4 family protein [Cyanobacteria bacterium P01_D01_bin.115]